MGWGMGRPQLQLLLIAIMAGATFVSAWVHGNPSVTFVAAAVTVVLLAKVIGKATEVLAEALGPSIGALLGATFGNSVELMIAILALRAGLYTVVKASIIGSIMANLLLTLGVCMFVGGLRRPVQTFNQMKAGLNSVMLFVAVIGLTITSIYSFSRPRVFSAEPLSIGVSIVFLLVYILGFVFSLFTHRTFLTAADRRPEIVLPPGFARTVTILLAATVLVALVSEELVQTLIPLTIQWRLNEQFVGLVFVPLIGVAPEFFSAILLARANRMDGSVEIAVGSSLQIALFVAPVLVLVGALSGRPLTLVFTGTEVVVIFLTTILVSLVSLDGESHWYEGVMVVATYAIFAMMFFFS